MGHEAVTVGLGVTGWVIIATYMAAVVVLGSLFAKGQEKVSDFFLAGRSMGWLPVAISIVATDLSAISYIGCPSWIYKEDTRKAFDLLAIPLLWAVGATIFLSLFYKLKLYTAYEFLERRFHISIRSATSFLFMLTRGSWLCMALFGASFTLSVVLGINYVLSVVIVGTLATLYTTLGGMKAVIWTDVLQFMVLVGGAVVALIVAIGLVPGGIGQLWEVALEHGKLRFPDFSFDPQEKITWWTLLFGGIILTISYFTTDQLILQRAFSAKSRRDSVLSGVATGLLSVPTALLLYAVGIALYSLYMVQPARNAALLALKAKGITEPADALLPHFIATSLHPALAGLIVAGIFAATMSSMDSGINSLTTVCVMDFYRRFFHKPTKTEEHYLRMSRWGTLVWGALGTLGAIGVGKLNLGTILQKGGEIAGPFSGPMVGMFALGVLTRRANTVGCLTGGGLGLVLALAAKPYVAFTWYGTVGVVATMLFGYPLSLLWDALVQMRNARKLVGGISGGVIGLALTYGVHAYALPFVWYAPVTILAVAAGSFGYALLWTRFEHRLPMEEITMLTVYRPPDADEDAKAASPAAGESGS